MAEAYLYRREDVTDQDGNVVYSGEFSAFSYIRNMLNKSDATDLFNMLKAMVIYNRTAKEFFGN